MHKQRNFGQGCTSKTAQGMPRLASHGRVLFLERKKQKNLGFRKIAKGEKIEIFVDEGGHACVCVTA